MRASRLLLLVLACAPACGGSAPSAGGDASIDVVPGTDVAEPDAAPAVVPPTPERLHLATGYALYPAAAGDRVAWLRIALEPGDGVVGGELGLSDCYTCPGCTGCRMEIRTLTRATGVRQVVAVQRADGVDRIYSGPGLDGQSVYWLSEYSTLTIWDAATGGRRVLDLRLGGTFQPFDWRRPLLLAGRVYAYGWRDSQYGFARFGLDGSLELFIPARTVEAMVPDIPYEHQRLLSRPVFATDGRRFAWPDANGTWAVRVHDLETSTEWVVDSRVGWQFAHVSLTPEGVVYVGMDTMHCDPECDVAVYLADGHQAPVRVTAPTAHVSRFGRPFEFGGLVHWIDYRDGPYALWAGAPGVPERRVLASETGLSAYFPPIRTPNALTWMERRDGVWGIYRLPVAPE